MGADHFVIEPDLTVQRKNIILNPDDDYFRELLKPYYAITADGQYLFGSHQMGRRPDCVQFMVPGGYRLGRGQRKFDPLVGRKLFLTIFEYLKTVPLLVQDGIQGEIGYKVGLRITTSLANPHSGYIGWMGKQMIFPPERSMSRDCWNYIVLEPLPLDIVREILTFWPAFDPTAPLTLFDLTGMDRGIRRVLNLGIDYFGGAFKKPNLTMVWNKAEGDGLISYHAGCTGDRVLKGLSGTGKTTLTVGPQLEQDDALLGLPLYDREGKVGAVELIGLEAGSFAKSEGLKSTSPEWGGLMASKKDGTNNGALVLAMNIDCENMEYSIKDIEGYDVKVPVPVDGNDPGHLLCTEYRRSGTTNGRFIFPFSALNKKWGYNRLKILRTEGLSFKRFDMVEPIIRIVDPVMAVALDSACESIITSAIAGKRSGTRVRSYAATDFMAREECEQALLKLKVYTDLGLGVDGKLVFVINNAGLIGEHDFLGNQIRVLRNGEPVPQYSRGSGDEKLDLSGNIVYQGQGEKISVSDSKTLIRLVEERRIKNWIINPIFGYYVPDPRELEDSHGLKDYCSRFNPLRFYSAEQIQAFAERDIAERSHFLKELFHGQIGHDDLLEVIGSWERIPVPDTEEIEEYYAHLYGSGASSH